MNDLHHMAQVDHIILMGDAVAHIHSDITDCYPRLHCLSIEQRFNR